MVEGEGERAMRTRVQSLEPAQDSRVYTKYTEEFLQGLEWERHMMGCIF